MAHDTVILFMAHYLTDAIMNEFRSIREGCSPNFAVRLLYDNSREDFDSSFFDEEPDVFLYTWNDVKTKYESMDTDFKSVVPGNCIFPILMFVKTATEFKYVWRIEYDARFSGDWNLLFHYFAKDPSDLLGTTLFRYNFRPEWNWWRSLKSPIHDLKKNSLLRGFFPVFRLSSKACAILEEAYRAGWKGHYEVSIPTILNLHGCSIEDIGGDGEFVKPENKNRFYTNTPAAAGLAPGTFVCPPHSCSDLHLVNKLYHPVKE